MNNSGRFPFFESIKYLNGRFYLLPLHYQRMFFTTKTHYGEGASFRLELENELKKISLPGLCKVKVYYNQHEFYIETSPYQKRLLPALHLVHADHILYNVKYTDRSALEQAKADFGEVLICQQHQLTDTSYANIALWNGKEWHTPIRSLLKGVKRSYYLQTKAIIEKPLSLFDLPSYQKISLINALLDLGELELPIEKIIGK